MTFVRARGEQESLDGNVPFSVIGTQGCKARAQAGGP